VPPSMMSAPLLPAMVSAHVRERIETDCAELLR